MLVNHLVFFIEYIDMYLLSHWFSLESLRRLLLLWWRFYVVRSSSFWLSWGEFSFFFSIRILWLLHFKLLIGGWLCVEIWIDNKRLVFWIRWRWWRIWRICTFNWSWHEELLLFNAAGSLILPWALSYFWKWRSSTWTFISWTDVKIRLNGPYSIHYHFRIELVNLSSLTYRLL